ncbi:MAG: ferrous iron transport protein A [Chloroflexi bacterium]|nr:ferrous iron transport protein A [Chloroflexota bacterium]
MHHDEQAEERPQASNEALRAGVENVISLADFLPGQSGTVLGLSGGPGFVGRMAALGFTPGAEVTMVRNPGRGPVIVSVLDTSVALGRGQASRVHVRPKG